MPKFSNANTSTIPKAKPFMELRYFDDDCKENIPPLGMLPMPPGNHWLSWNAEWDMLVPRHMTVGERRPLHDLVSAAVGVGDTGSDVAASTPTSVEDTVAPIGSRPTPCQTSTQTNQDTPTAQNRAMGHDQDFIRAISDAVSTCNLWSWETENASRVYADLDETNTQSGW